MAEFISLYSGSSGNSSVVRCGAQYLIVDMGKGVRTTTAALKSLGLAISDCAGILVTHEHSDHVKGLSTFLKKNPLPVYGAAATLDFLDANDIVPANCALNALEGREEDIGCFGVQSFPTSHDVPCVGYRIHTPDNKTMTIATDLGVLTPPVHQALSGCDLVALESNYDLHMLRSGPYPYYLRARIESVRAGIALVKKHRLGGVLAVGGGSVIDCAKAIAGGAATPHEDAWDLVVSSAFTAALPVFSVLTLSATGSEMDAFAVITNFETNEKLGCVVARPVCSVLDPSYTFTVPAHQTAAGSADILSHIFESYFSKVRTAYVQDRFAEALLKTVIRYAPVAMEKPDDYEARANLMWASSLAINDLIKEGKGEDWTVHGIEHELSAFYDITHGVGLAILTPRWMRYVLSEETLWRFRMYGVNVWGIVRTARSPSARSE